MPLEEKLEISFVLFLWVEAAGCLVDVCVFWLVVSEVSCCVVVRCSYHDCRNPECSLQKAFLTPHGHCWMAFGQPVAVSPVHHPSLRWHKVSDDHDNSGAQEKLHLLLRDLEGVPLSLHSGEGGGRRRGRRRRVFNKLLRRAGERYRSGSGYRTRGSHGHCCFF